KSRCTVSGVASVATSQSCTGRPNRASRTPPPTTKAWYPAPRSTSQIQRTGGGTDICNGSLSPIVSREHSRHVALAQESRVGFVQVDVEVQGEVLAHPDDDVVEDHR